MMPIIDQRITGIILVVFLLMVSPLRSQDSTVKRIFKKEDCVRQLETLREQYGQNKKIPSEYELLALIALSQYPELKNTRIEFVEKRIKTTMAARPATKSIFQRKEKRLYRIYINNDEDKLKGMLLKDVPFNGQIGVIAHELAHILDYTGRTSFGLIGYGVGYLSQGFRTKLEKKTDEIAIRKGFGWQLHCFNDHLYHCSQVEPKYKEYKEKNYYSPTDILELIAESQLYPYSASMK